MPSFTGRQQAGQMGHMFGKLIPPASQEGQQRWTLPEQLGNFDSLQNKHKAEEKLAQLNREVQQLQGELDTVAGNLTTARKEEESAETERKATQTAVILAENAFAAKQSKQQSTIAAMQTELKSLGEQKQEIRKNIKSRIDEIDDTHAEVAKLREQEIAYQTGIITNLTTQIVTEMKASQEVVRAGNRIDEITAIITAIGVDTDIFNLDPAELQTTRQVDVVFQAGIVKLAEREFLNRATEEFKAATGEYHQNKLAFVENAERSALLKHYVTGIMAYLQTRISTDQGSSTSSIVGDLRSMLEVGLGTSGSPANSDQRNKFFTELVALEKRGVLERGGLGILGDTPAAKVKAFVDILSPLPTTTKATHKAMSPAELQKAADGYLAKQGGEFSRKVLASNKGEQVEVELKKAVLKEGEVIEESKTAKMYPWQWDFQQSLEKEKAGFQRSPPSEDKFTTRAKEKTKKFTAALVGVLRRDDNSSQAEKTLNEFLNEFPQESALHMLVEKAKSPTKLTVAQQQVFTELTTKLKEEHEDYQHLLADLEPLAKGTLARTPFATAIQQTQTTLREHNTAVEQQQFHLEKLKSEYDQQGFKEKIDSLDQRILQKEGDLRRYQQTAERENRQPGTEITRLKTKVKEADLDVQKKSTALTAIVAEHKQAENKHAVRNNEFTKIKGEVADYQSGKKKAETPADRSTKLTTALCEQVIIAAMCYLNRRQQASKDPSVKLQGYHGDVGIERALGLVSTVLNAANFSDVVTAINKTLTATRWLSGDPVLGDDSFNTYLLKALYNENPSFQGIFSMKFDGLQNPLYPSYPDEIKGLVANKQQYLNSTPEQQQQKLITLHMQDKAKPILSGDHVNALSQSESQRVTARNLVVNELAQLKDKLQQNLGVDKTPGERM